MEIIIFIAVVVGAALLWNGYVKAKKADSDDAIDKWIPGGPGKNPEQHPLAKFNADADKPWPYGEKLPEGKIHVKTTDVSGSENRVETPAPTVADVTAENKAEAVAKVKKAPVKKTAANPAVANKPAAAKRAPAKKKST
jgi:hypothetical protein